MLIVEKRLLDGLSTLQKKVLEHITHLCLADVVLERRDGDVPTFECYLTRVPYDELNYDSEEEYLASAQEIAPDYMLALERDVSLKPETKPILLDQWPEKQFCHPEKHPGECSWQLNYCQLQCSGKEIDEVLWELLECLELLFDGWHLELDDVSEKRYSMNSYRAMWHDEIDEQECLDQLDAEKEGWGDEDTNKSN